MADLALETADLVTPLDFPTVQHTGVAGEAIEAGAPVYLDATTGKFMNSDANDATAVHVFGIALRSVAANQNVTVLRRGLLSGFVLTDQDYGEAIYVSNTAGALADAAGGTSLQVAIVVPVWTQPLGSAPDKALLVECVEIGT